MCGCIFVDARGWDVIIRRKMSKSKWKKKRWIKANSKSFLVSQPCTPFNTTRPCFRMKLPNSTIQNVYIYRIVRRGIFVQSFVFIFPVCSVYISINFNRYSRIVCPWVCVWVRACVFLGFQCFRFWWMIELWLLGWFGLVWLIRWFRSFNPTARRTIDIYLIQCAIDSVTDWFYVFVRSLQFHRIKNRGNNNEWLLYLFINFRFSLWYLTIPFVGGKNRNSNFSSLSLHLEFGDSHFQCQS